MKLLLFFSGWILDTYRQNSCGYLILYNTQCYLIIKLKSKNGANIMKSSIQFVTGKTKMSLWSRSHKV